MAIFEVLPLLPIVLGAAVGEHRLGPAALAAGLAVSFVTVGLFVATIGFAVGLLLGVVWSSCVGPTLGAASVLAAFSEPAIYLVQPGWKLYFGSVQTMPFARPHFADILSATDVVVARNYPARGEVTGLSRAAA